MNNRQNDGNKYVPYRNLNSGNVSFVNPHNDFYSKLPIYSYREDIAANLLQYPPLVITAPTGTGKTIFIPYFLLSKNYYRIRIAIPTKVATYTAYEFNKNNSGKTVGYRAGRRGRYSDADAIVYATTGHFAEKILEIIGINSKIDNARRLVRDLLGDVLLVDEVHTATKEISLLVGLVSYLFPYENEELYKMGPKIIFATATYDRTIIGDFYPKIIPLDLVKLSDSRLVSPYKIQEIFLSQPRNPLVDNKGFNQMVIKIINDEFDKSQKFGKVYHGIIFRPGANEVNQTIEMLESAIGSTDKIGFYPMYSGLSAEELLRASQENNRKMKIIVATNIIESGVTIKDVGFIVNDFLEKVSGTNVQGQKKLELTILTKSGAVQRKGRTGRTMDGTVYQMISKKEYDALKEFGPKEIDRVPIHDLILKIIKVGLMPREILKMDEYRYDMAVNKLLSLKMIDRFGDELKITKLGIFISKIPLNINNSYMIFVAMTNYLLETGFRPNDYDESVAFLRIRTVIAVASMIDAYEYGFFYFPYYARKKNPTEEEKIKKDELLEKHEKFYGPTDIHTLTNIFLRYLVDSYVIQSYEKQNFTFRSGRGLFKWTKKNAISGNPMIQTLISCDEIESIVANEMKSLNELYESQFRFAFSQRSYTPNDKDSTFADLGDYVADVFVKSYANQAYQLDKNNRYNKYISVTKGSDDIVSIDNKSRLHNFYPKPVYIIGAYISENNNGKFTNKFLSVIVDDRYIKLDFSRPRQNVINQGVKIPIIDVPPF